MRENGFSIPFLWQSYYLTSGEILARAHGVAQSDTRSFFLSARRAVKVIILLGACWSDGAAGR